MRFTTNWFTLVSLTTYLNVCDVAGFHGEQEAKNVNEQPEGLDPREYSILNQQSNIDPRKKNVGK